MTDRVYYLGRAEDPPGTWTVRFAQGRAGVHSATYWLSFTTKNLVDSVDIDAPNFWGLRGLPGWQAHRERPVPGRRELFRSRGRGRRESQNDGPPLVEPPVGAVCWRFGSPPYDPEDD